MMACLQDKLRINGRNPELGQFIKTVAFALPYIPQENGYMKST